MKKSYLLIGLLSLLVIIAFKKKDSETDQPLTENNNEEEEEEEEEEETTLTILSDGSQTFSGNLSNGEILSDLSWAWNSSMACFVEPVDDQYKGNHVFYLINLPEASIIDIYLTPNNSSDQIALYGYSKGAGNTDIPPNIYSSISCEADPSNNNGATTGDRHIYFNATTNPYSVIIGVAGAEGFTSGGYSIEIVIES